MTAENKARLLVVSNRLPVNIKKNPEGSEQPWTYEPSSGGLVSALSGLKKQMSFLWIGWPGIRKVHVPIQIDFDEAQWDGYYRANMAFATAIKQVAQDGDMIWVQDYHLMLLPALLREALADKRGISIGFFLHTPFPSSEVYRVLPVRKQILLGVLQCDLIGFHTYDYARHFLSSCARILGLQTMPNGVEYEGRFIHVGTFPIGIDPDKFINGLDDPVVKQKIEELQGRFAGKKLMVGVDRLDYIKGVPHKLYAFDLFLSRYPEFQGKVALLQVAVPTRTEVEEYKNLRTSVNELVGRINGKFGTFNFTPVQYLYRSVSFEDLVALYRVADVCVVTSTRDGMNLVSYEYIATQTGKHGALVLSEFAGAAQSMNGAFIVNPWNIDELVEAYREALSTLPDVAASNHQKLLKYVTKQTASHWGQSFVSELQKFPLDLGSPRPFIRLDTKIIDEPFKKAVGTRLIVVDHDLLDERPSPYLNDALNRLAHAPNTLVYIFSTQSRTYVENAFLHGNVGLVCEYGCFIRHPIEVRLRLTTQSAADDWISLSDLGDESWRERILPLFKFYADHTPGSFIDIGEKVITWNFGESDLEFGTWQASELQANLEKLLGHVPISDRLILRPSVVDDSVALHRIMADLTKLDEKCAFLLSVNNRLEDFKLSTSEQQNEVSVFISSTGKTRSSAPYYIEGPKELAILLSGCLV